MPIFTGFNQNIPATGHSPADDYQQMQTNNVASYNIMSVDHYTYDGAYPGEHVQCTFPQVIVPTTLPTPPNPSTPSGQASILYPAPGIASPSTANLIFQNSNSLFLASAIRAFGVINITGSDNDPLTSLNYYGITLTESTEVIVDSKHYTYTIQLLPNVIQSSNCIVFVSGNNTSDEFKYSLTTSTLTVNLFGFSYPTGRVNIKSTLLNFCIIQA